MTTLLRLVAVAALVTSAGCASLLTGGPLVRHGKPTGAIRITNVGSGDIKAVMISDCNASTYGRNRLPTDMAIPPGESYDFTVSAGCWDAAAGIVGHRQTHKRMRVSAASRVDWRVGG